MSSWKNIVLVSLVVGVVAMLGSTEAKAEEAEEPAYSGHVNPEDYQPAPEGRQENTVSAPLMVSLAYGFFWLLAIGFLFSLWSRGKGLTDEVAAAEARLAMLDERLEELDPGAPT